MRTLPNESIPRNPEIKPFLEPRIVCHPRFLPGAVEYKAMDSGFLMSVSGSILADGDLLATIFSKTQWARIRRLSPGRLLSLN